MCRTSEEGSGGEARPQRSGGQTQAELREDEHEGEGPVGGLGNELGLVGSGGFGRDVAADVAGSGSGDFRGGGAGEKVVIFPQESGVNLDDGDGFGGAGLNAGGGFAIGEALVAHVAFADDAAFFRIFGDVVGALEDAVFAADALIIEMADDAGVGFLFVSADGTAIEAFRVEAVVAGGGNGLLEARI